LYGGVKFLNVPVMDIVRAQVGSDVHSDFMEKADPLLQLLLLGKADHFETCPINT
jgi:hypothetical protein